MFNQIQPSLIPYIFIRILAKTSDESGKSLIEPEIVPPVHGDEISKPLMSQFVHYHILHPGFLFSSGFGLEQNMFSVSNTAHILHRSEIVFGTDDIVHFGVRVRDVYEIIIERESVLSYLEPFFGISLGQILLVGLAAENAEGDFSVL
jgi:hypothetical protein